MRSIPNTLFAAGTVESSPKTMGSQTSSPDDGAALSAGMTDAPKQATVDGRNPANHLGCIKPVNNGIYPSLINTVEEIRLTS